MTRPLLLGALHVPGTQVMRSGLRWLRGPGARCRPGEPVATCHIGLVPTPGTSPAALPFRDEKRDLKAVLTTPIAGTFYPHADASRGGFLDQHAELFWRPDDTIGTLDPADGPTHGPLQLNLLMLAGRRMTELAEGRTGLLTSWHDRRRAWWGEGTPTTLLSIGTCELAGVIQGDAGGFLDLHHAATGPAQIVVITDEPLAPCTRVLREQMTRTAADQQAIVEDATLGFLACGVTPTPADWLFMGALLAGLARTPLTDSTDILTRTGIRQAPAGKAIILSLAAEARDVLRHRHLGYTVSLYDFRLAECGPATRAWLRANFDVIARTPDDIRADYRDFLQEIRTRTGAATLVLNRIATDAGDSIVSYAGLDSPLSASLRSIRGRELNLMLHDLTRDFDLEIVDAEAIAASLGVVRHIPDYLHPGGHMQAELRAEILHILRRRGLPGFAPHVTP